MINLFIACLISLFACTPKLNAPDTEIMIEVSDPIFGFTETSNCGYNLNNSACNFGLKDKNGDYWELDETAGNLILLDLSAMWCAPCQKAAMTAQATQDEFESQGFLYVTILFDDTYGESVEVEDAKLWAESFEITTAPVLVGTRDMLTSGGATDYGFRVASWPTFILLDRKQKITFTLAGFNEEWIHSQIENNL